MNDLIAQLVSNLNVDESQAKGGAGLLLKLAKDRLAGADFGKVADTIGDTDELIEAAPEEGAASQLFGSIAGALGGSKGGQLGDLAGLASGFKKLDLDADMIVKFIQIVLKFVQEHGGDIVKKILAQVLEDSKS